MNNIDREVRIILGPLAVLLRSRKFVMAVLTLAVVTLVHLVPQLQPYYTELTASITVLGGLVMLFIYGEDTSPVKNPPPPATPALAVDDLAAELKKQFNLSDELVNTVTPIVKQIIADWTPPVMPPTVPKDPTNLG